MGINVLSAFIKRYPFWSILKRYRKRYLLGAAALVLVNLINVSLPLVMKRAIDSIAAKRSEELVWLALGYALGILILAVGRYLWRVYLIGTSHLIAKDLRVSLYQRLQTLPLSEYSKIRTGDLMSRATNDIDAIRMALGPGVLVTADAILIFLMFLPVMFLLSWKLSLMALAFFPFVPIITTKVGQSIDKRFEQMQTRMSKMGAFTQEVLSAVRLIKTMTLEPVTYRRFQEMSDGYRQEGISLAKSEAILNPAMSLLTYSGIFLILLMGGREVIAGAITIGTFVAFQRFVVQLQWPMEAVGWAVTLNREGFAAHRRIQEIFDLPVVESVRIPEARAKYGSELTFLPAEFKYPTGDFCLSLPDFKVEQGAKIGIVGPVGCGKTTFFNLLLRLYEPPLNSVFFRGQDIASIPLERLRGLIASVEQEVFLFSDSLQENISMGLSSLIEQDNLESLAERAVILPEIASLSMGFQTRLGEKGVNLSGGQKQRIAMMRAMARAPSLYLLDDSFSAMDVEVEQKIIDQFLSFAGDKTLMVASHRLSVMPRMDEIWLMDSGKFVARGSHGSLMHSNVWYRNLWRDVGAWGEKGIHEPNE